MSAPTRNELIALCTDGVVPVELWHDRDSSSAQRQLGEARALLEAGCEFRFPDEPKATGRTIWLRIIFPGFGAFDAGEPWDEELFYLPTRARLATASGKDWY